MFMSVFTDAARVEDEGLCALSWTALPDMGEVHPAGQAAKGVLNRADLIFVLSDTPARRARDTQGLNWPNGPAILRIDEVCFPAGVKSAYHTHAGAGFRHLVRGALEIEMGGVFKVMEPRDNWFEPVATPVRAVAVPAEGVTSLVRCMVIPTAFAGKSTFQPVGSPDQDVPQLQAIHRHLECAVTIGDT